LRYGADLHGCTHWERTRACLSEPYRKRRSSEIEDRTVVEIDAMTPFSTATFADLDFCFVTRLPALATAHASA
jgi:hypothetical protein